MNLAGIDAYVVRARIAPLTLVITPFLIFISAISFPLSAWNATWPVFGFAIILLVAELGRDLGKRLEPELWRSWGGAPTTVMLRYRAASNRVIVDDRHRRVERAVGGITLPTVDEEVADPSAADDAYETAVAVLRSRTQDSTKFPRVYSENVSYGFRRNVYGLRRWGVGSCAATLFCCLAAVAPLYRSGGIPATMVLALPLVAAASALWLWRRVNTAWVKVPADAYAERIMHAASELAE
ncbi:MAG: hypothetical protein M3P26_04240 [Gemmatimonadota bacterium]|nr:hypothetical protein [Gemmatimonadota bacterium]